MTMKMGRDSSMSHAGVTEVAEYAGVSRSTVSNFFNHPERLSKGSHERVTRAIEALGYVRNEAARQLRVGSSDAIALVAFEVSNPYFSAYLDSIEERAFANGLHLVLGNSRSSIEREKSYLDLFERERVLGVIAATLDPSTEVRLLQMRQRGIPSVILGRKSTATEIPALYVDDQLGGELAAAHLFETGKARLAFIGGPLGLEQIDARLRGAIAASSKHPGTRVEAVEVVERSVAEGRRVMLSLLERPAGDRPDAVFAANDLLAIGAMIEAQSRGVRVPEDMAFVGYDDIDFDSYVATPLSSVSHPRALYGHAAVDMLVAQIEDSTRLTATVKLTPELVVRASSRREAR